MTNVLGKLGYRVPWWQLTFFADCGRVAPDFDLREFHRNMKTTAEVGFLILAEGLLIRIDFARSEEESAILVAIDQTFWRFLSRHQRSANGFAPMVYNFRRIFT